MKHPHPSIDRERLRFALNKLRGYYSSHHWTETTWIFFVERIAQLLEYGISPSQFMRLRVTPPRDDEQIELF